MNLNEAIETLTTWQERIITHEDERYGDALNLGIEALKNLIQQRADWLIRCYKPLPGETRN